MEYGMWQAQQELLGSYILQHKLPDTSCFEQWVAVAIYSPYRFLLRFLKKEIPSFCVEALKKEILSLYHYSVEGVIPIVEVETVETQLVVSSEYRDEFLLRDLVPSDFPRDEEFLFALALRLARALCSFHTHGVCWGGLLPEGLWIRKKLPRPEDFFLLPPSYAASFSFLLQQNMISQKDLFLVAPEIREGKTASVQGDIYSFGGILQWLGTGGILSPGLDAILSRCSEPNPSLRYRSLEEVIQALESWGEKQGIVQKYGTFDRYQKGVDRDDTRGGSGTTLIQEGGYPLPQSEPRAEVLHYFQALSETYRSRYGYEGTEKNTLSEMLIRSGAAKAISSTAPGNVVLTDKKETPRKENIPTGRSVPGEEDRTTRKNEGTGEEKKGGGSESEVVRGKGGISHPGGERPSFLKAPPDGISPLSGERDSLLEQETPLYPAPEEATIAFRWERNRVLLQDVEKILEEVVRRSRTGRGDLRFIVTSDVLSLKQTIEEADFWPQFRQRVRLIVIEPVSPFVNPLTLNNFISSLMKGIEKSLAQESFRRRQRLEKILRELCKNYRLAKKKEDLESSFISSNGVTSLQQCSEIFQDPQGAASCLIALSSPRKPLFLIWWCSTELDNSLTSYLRNLIPFVLEKPFCFWVWTETIPSGIP